MTFQPTLDSVRQHQVPDWYHDGKLGIFVHWGLFSVPGYAPLAGDISSTSKDISWRHWFENNSYAEWYLNSMKFEHGPTGEYHRATYGPNFTYDDFAPQFDAATAQWDPSAWADLFQKIGARYVVLTTKHHDGFTLWPPTRQSPRKPDYHTSRDLVGALTEAVRARGLRMGLYYSGGLDWAFEERVIADLSDVSGTIVQTPEFVQYSVNHWKELIDRYQPSVLWNDIGYPVNADLGELFAYYYNHVPDGVINDRWSQGAIESDIISNPENAHRGPHYDFITPEYSSFRETQTRKWEGTRGIGHSFGYNRNEGDAQLLGRDELIHLFVDVVSKNGNLLLNVGPMADGTIPENQRLRLESLGAWLDVNGEAIFGTRPWVKAESKASDGLEVRFTKQGGAVYATLLGTPTSREVGIDGLRANLNTTVQLLGSAEVLHWTQDGDRLTVTLPDHLAESAAHTLKLTSVTG